MTKGMLLCAGKGTRLLPLTEHYPKTLFPIGDRPCICYLIELIRDCGMRDIIINLHHLGDIISDFLGDGSALGVRITYSREDKLLGTGGGVRKAFSLIEDNDDLLVINGDNLIDFDPARLIRFQTAKSSIATMALMPRTGDSPYTPVYLNPKSFLSQIGGKGDGRSYFFPGVQLLSRDFIKHFTGRNPRCIIRNGYQPCLKEGLPIAGMPTTGYWREISTIPSYWEANLDFLRGKAPAYFYRGREDFTRRGIHAGKRSQLGQRIRFHYPVYLGEDCVIGSETALGPNVLVGGGSRVGENCHLENAIIWPETRIRKGSVIKNAIITPFGRISLDESKA